MKKKKLLLISVIIALFVLNSVKSNIIPSWRTVNIELGLEYLNMEKSSGNLWNTDIINDKITYLEISSGKWVAFDINSIGLENIHPRRKDVAVCTSSNSTLIAVSGTIIKYDSKNKIWSKFTESSINEIGAFRDCGTSDDDSSFLIGLEGILVEGNDGWRKIDYPENTNSKNTGPVLSSYGLWFLKKDGFIYFYDGKMDQWELRASLSQIVIAGGSYIRFISSDDHYWVINGDAIYRFSLSEQNSAPEMVLSLVNNNRSIPVAGIAEDSQGRIWIVFSHDTPSLMYYQGGQLNEVSVRRPYGSYINSMFINQKLHRLYVVSDIGIFYMDLSLVP
ncbi:MAG: hypothetical protein OEZ02_11090 [Anaerolineae bacterium]|nr:hypothetical protein [Anaerolineae bacterium]